MSVRWRFFDSLPLSRARFLRLFVFNSLCHVNVSKRRVCVCLWLWPTLCFYFRRPRKHKNPFWYRFRSLFLLHHSTNRKPAKLTRTIPPHTARSVEIFKQREFNSTQKEKRTHMTRCDILKSMMNKIKTWSVFVAEAVSHEKQSEVRSKS